MSHMKLEGWLTVRDVAAMTGCKPDTIRKYHQTGKMPPAADRVDATILFEEDHVRRWWAGEDECHPRPGRGARTDLRRRAQET